MEGNFSDEDTKGTVTSTLFLGCIRNFGVGVGRVSLHTKDSHATTGGVPTWKGYEASSQPPWKCAILEADPLDNVKLADDSGTS